MGCLNPLGSPDLSSVPLILMLAVLGTCVVAEVFCVARGRMYRKENLNEVTEKAENDMCDDMRKNGMLSFDMVSRLNTPMNWDCDGFGRLWHCSALSLPLLMVLLGNRDNKSSSKENRIGAKFPQ